MRTVSLVLFMATLLSGPVQAQSKPEFIVFEHPRAPGKVSEDKLHRSLQFAAQEMHVSAELQSSIYVFHVSAADAKAAGVEMTSVWKTLRGGGSRYELWVVGEPTDEVYGSLAVSLLKDSLGLSLQQEEAKRLKDSVALKLATTLEAGAAQRRHTKAQ
jgi:hypothetical protein